MKKIILLLTCLLAVLSAGADISVCNVAPDANGHFNSPYIKSGSITWDNTSKTLTLDNAVVEYYTDNKYDFVYPLTVTEDATIVVHGECKLLTNGFSAIDTHSYSMKYITITGDGSLSTSSTWIDIYLYCARLTIKDIYLETVNGIAENGNGVNVALTFDNVRAYIKGRIERIGEGITFKNCSITYPADAYIAEYVGYGYAIYYGNGDIPDHIIISRDGENPGDVNGDGEVNIADVNTLIDMILSGNHSAKGDVNEDNEVNIADVNALIDMILNH